MLFIVCLLLTGEMVTHLSAESKCPGGNENLRILAKSGESLETAEKQFLEARGGCGKSRALAGTPSAGENVCESMTQCRFCLKYLNLFHQHHLAGRKSLLSVDLLTGDTNL